VTETETEGGRRLPSSRFGDRLALRVSWYGERVGRGWLIYNPGMMRIYHRLARADAEPVARALRARFPNAARWADVGAGSGAFAAALRRQGVEVVAYERSLVGRLIGISQRVPVRSFDLTRPRPVANSGPSPDLAYCFEVAEHLDAELGDHLVDFLADLAPTVVFTAAPPGQGGAGHLNEQPRDYWVTRFAAKGLRFDEDGSSRLSQSFRDFGVAAPWLVENLMVFARA
jgi:hypothetical protein